jgi:hypothetical protein
VLLNIETFGQSTDGTLIAAAGLLPVARSSIAKFRISLGNLAAM